MSCTAALAHTIAWLRRIEPRLEAVARATTGGISRTEWARSPEILAELEGVKPRHIDRNLFRLVQAARRVMETERAAILADCERRMASPEWAAWTKDEQDAYLMTVAAASAGDERGGPTALLSSRVLERALFAVFGTRRCHNTLVAIMGRLEERGCFDIEKGRPGYATKDNATRYRLLKEDHYTSPKARTRACSKGPGAAWLKRMEPLFARLREAFGESILYFRRIKTLREYRYRHIPWSECYFVAEEFDDEACAGYLDALFELPPASSGVP